MLQPVCLAANAAASFVSPFPSLGWCVADFRPRGFAVLVFGKPRGRNRGVNTRQTNERATNLDANRNELENRFNALRYSGMQTSITVTQLLVNYEKKYT